MNIFNVLLLKYVLEAIAREGGRWLGNNTSLLLVSKNYKKKEERMEGEGEQEREVPMGLSPPLNIDYKLLIKCVKINSIKARNGRLVVFVSNRQIAKVFLVIKCNWFVLFY